MAHMPMSASSSLSSFCSFALSFLLAPPLAAAPEEDAAAAEDAPAASPDMTTCLWGAAEEEEELAASTAGGGAMAVEVGAEGAERHTTVTPQAKCVSRERRASGGCRTCAQRATLSPLFALTLDGARHGRRSEQLRVHQLALHLLQLLVELVLVHLRSDRLSHLLVHLVSHLDLGEQKERHESSDNEG